MPSDVPGPSWSEEHQDAIRDIADTLLGALRLTPDVAKAIAERAFARAYAVSGCWPPDRDTSEFHRLWVAGIGEVTVLWDARLQAWWDEGNWRYWTPQEADAKHLHVVQPPAPAPAEVGPALYVRLVLGLLRVTVHGGERGVHKAFNRIRLPDCPHCGKMLTSLGTEPVQRFHPDGEVEDTGLTRLTVVCHGYAWRILARVDPATGVADGYWLSEDGREPDDPRDMRPMPATGDELLRIMMTQTEGTRIPS